MVGLDLASYNFKGTRIEAPVRQKLFDILCAHPYGITNRELADKLYADDPDGGPDNAGNAINVVVVYLNRQLAKMNSNLRVKGSGGPGSRYQLWLAKDWTDAKKNLHRRS